MYIKYYFDELLKDNITKISPIAFKSSARAVGGAVCSGIAAGAEGEGLISRIISRLFVFQIPGCFSIFKF